MKTKKFTHKIAALAIAGTIFLSISTSTPTNAAVFLINPPVWTGVLAGAAIMGGGFVIIDSTKKIESAAGRFIVGTIGIAVAIFGFLVLDDNKVVPVLGEFPTDSKDPKFQKLLADNNISADDIEIYNAERLLYQGVIEDVINEAVESKKEMSLKDKSELLYSQAQEAGISDSTMKIAGLLDAIAKEASK